VSLSEPFDDGIIYDAALLSGIEENNILNSFDVYPNPCQNELNLRINSSEFLSKYEVFNSLGQMIQSGMLEFSHSTINTSDFPQGCYMISINGIAYQRFQVVR
jgi:hypothetical protein